MSAARSVYLDNAATSHPKPDVVYRAVADALQAGGNPGRGGHRYALAAGRRVLAAREAVANLFGVADASRVIFTASATHALNLAVKGLLRPGDHCITTAVEHNALRRPLAALERRGVAVTWLPVSPEGVLDPQHVQQALRPQTRLIALAHGSNVTGALQPIAAVAEIARRAGVFLLLDAAQTAGVLPIDMPALGVHLLAAPGHKGLLGPQGTGVLCVDPAVPLLPVLEGGTGGMSTPAEQPVAFPEGFESGTLNTPGIAGLGAAVAFLYQAGLQAVRDREQELIGSLTEGLRSIPGVVVYGPGDPSGRCGVVSFNIRNCDPAELEERLDEEYGIIGRSGLHCNPGAHALLATAETGGTMRLSPGFFTTPADVAAALQAVKALATTMRH